MKVFCCVVRYRTKGEEFSLDLFDLNKSKVNQMVNQARDVLREMGIKKFHPERVKVVERLKGSSGLPKSWPHQDQQQEKAEVAA